MTKKETTSSDHESVIEADEPTIEGSKVTNLHHQPLNVCGVVIAGGGTELVADFDANLPLIAAWLNAKVISATDA